MASRIRDPELKSYMTRYINETNPSQWERLVIFGTGGTDPTRLPCVAYNRNARLPEAHTCANNIDFGKYTDYQQFKEKLDIALENSEGFGIS